MLGLGNSLVGGAALEEAFTPESISNIAVWLAWNTNITADEDSGGTALDPDHTTAASTMANGDRISSWNAAGSTSVNATQDTTGDKPRWSTTTGEVGGVYSANNNKHMDLSSNVTFDANTDFTIVIRFRANDFGGARVFLGHTASEFIRLDDENTIRFKTDGTTSDINSGTDLVADKDTTLIIVRSDGSTGNVNMFVRGKDSGYFDGTATGTAWGSEFQDTEEIVVSNIMASADNTNEFDGTFKDVIIYDGTAVTSGQRKQLFDYLEAQED
tara:strand:+ start:16 stop:828 length:813 start_codon:yes stop_codon:yes gene_type:complete